MRLKARPANAAESEEIRFRVDHTVPKSITPTATGSESKLQEAVSIRTVMLPNSVQQNKRDSLQSHVASS